MDPDRLYRLALIGLLAGAVVSFLALLFVPAPYGRHERPGWGPSLPTRLAWVLQELPAPVAFAALYASGPYADRLVPLLFLGLWELHYLQRTFVYPLRMRVGTPGIPASTAALAVLFNVVNGSANGWAVGAGGLQADPGWLADLRCGLGIAIFLVGWAGNLHSDALLRRLRAPGETGYRIPHGGLFRFVSAPNYLCEIVEWCGWALATWTAAGAVFALFTIANLAPRALAHHRWYRDRFPDYPPERRALIPFLL